MTTTYTAQQALNAQFQGTLVGAVAILDSYSAVQADLDALKPLAIAGEIASISFSDPYAPTMVVQSPQAINDLKVLSLFRGSYIVDVGGASVAQTQQLLGALSQVSIGVYDSAAAVTANLDALQAVAGKLSGIGFSDSSGTVTFTQTQFAADAAAISLINPGSVTLTMAGTFSVGMAVEAETANRWIQGLTVVDSLASFEAELGILPDRPYLMGLHPNVYNPYRLASVTLTDSGVLSITAPYANYQNDEGFLSALTNPHSVDWTNVPVGGVSNILSSGSPSSLIGSKVEIVDVAATVASAIDYLETYDKAGQIGSITVTDGNLPSFTAAQSANDASVIAKITVADIPAAAAVVEAGQLSALNGVIVQDNAAHIAASLDGLESIAAAGKLVGINLAGFSPQTLTISAAQVTSDAAALAAIKGSYELDITAGSGAATIKGFAGAGNVAVFSGNASQYTVTTANGTVNVSINGITDQLSGISALKFADVTEIVAAAPGPANAVTTGNITELYSAVLAREPDAAGLSFYQNFLQKNPGTGLIQFATWFLDSNEYGMSHTYAESTAGDQQFIQDSYQNLLHRAPSASELSYYETNVLAPAVANLPPGTTAYLAAQTQAHALMLVYFSSSPEFLADVQVTAQNPASASHWLLLA